MQKKNRKGFIKQCSYCLRVLGEDGAYHDEGYEKAIGEMEGVSVSHSICPECYQHELEMLHVVSVAARRKEAVGAR